MTITASPIMVDRQAALKAYHGYLKHRHYSQPIDYEIARAYKAIADGKMVIQAMKAVTDAGLNAKGLPHLAICRADATICYLDLLHNGRARFAMKDYVRDNEVRTFIDFPAGSFSHAERTYRTHRATVPLIPIHLRPRRGLQNYHVLWEAEWEPVPPVDPLLLRRIGVGDLWMVVAAWELTPIEQAALSARIRLS